MREGCGGHLELRTRIHWRAHAHASSRVSDKAMVVLREEKGWRDSECVGRGGGGGEEAGDNQRPKERLEVGAGITIALCGQTLRK